MGPAGRADRVRDRVIARRNGDHKNGGECSAGTAQTRIVRPKPGSVKRKGASRCRQTAFQGVPNPRIAGWGKVRTVAAPSLQVATVALSAILRDENRRRPRRARMPGPRPEHRHPRQRPVSSNNNLGPPGQEIAVAADGRFTAVTGSLPTVADVVVVEVGSNGSPSLGTNVLFPGNNDHQRRELARSSRAARAISSAATDRTARSGDLVFISRNGGRHVGRDERPVPERERRTRRRHEARHQRRRELHRVPRALRHRGVRDHPGRRRRRRLFSRDAVHGSGARRQHGPARRGQSRSSLRTRSRSRSRASNAAVGDLIIGTVGGPGHRRRTRRSPTSSSRGKQPPVEPRAARREPDVQLLRRARPAGDGRPRRGRHERARRGRARSRTSSGRSQQHRLRALPPPPPSVSGDGRLIAVNGTRLDERRRGPRADQCGRRPGRRRERRVPRIEQRPEPPAPAGGLVRRRARPPARIRDDRRPRRHPGRVRLADVDLGHAAERALPVEQQRSRTSTRTSRSRPTGATRSRWARPRSATSSSRRSTRPGSPRPPINVLYPASNNVADPRLDAPHLARGQPRHHERDDHDRRRGHHRDRRQLLDRIRSEHVHDERPLPRVERQHPDEPRAGVLPHDAVRRVRRHLHDRRSRVHPAARSRSRASSPAPTSGSRYRSGSSPRRTPARS